MKGSQDAVGFVELLRLLCHRKGYGQKNGMLEAVKAVHLLRMQDDSRLDNYQGYSQANVKVCKALGIKIGCYEAATDIVP